MNRLKIIEIFKWFKNNNPKPTTELHYSSPFELLIAVMLSAQATDISVNKATNKLYPVANTPRAILELGEEGLIPYIKTIGLFRTKAKNVLKTCQLLLEQYHGQVPATREALESLPGVGRKTANVILNTLYGEPVMAVDTHIFRIANRIGLVKAKTPLQVEQQLIKIIPKEYLQDAHHWLILHGRYVCLARRPKCQECSIAEWCEFKGKNL